MRQVNVGGSFSASGAQRPQSRFHLKFSMFHIRQPFVSTCSIRWQPQMGRVCIGVKLYHRALFRFFLLFFDSFNESTAKPEKSGSLETARRWLFTPSMPHRFWIHLQPFPPINTFPSPYRPRSHSPHPIRVWHQWHCTQIIKKLVEDTYT